MRSKKWRKGLALLLASALLWGVLPAAGESGMKVEAAVEVENLLVNGDFELADEDGKALDWQTVLFSGAPSVMVDDSVYKSGARSYKLSAESVSRVAIKQEALLDPGLEGKTFRLQLWMKTDNLNNPGDPSAAKAYGRYQFYNSAGARIGAVRYLDIVQHTIDWTLSQVEFNMPAGAVRMAFEGFLENSTGTVWYDDIRLYEVLPDEPEEPELPPDGNLLPNGGFEEVGTSDRWLGNVGPTGVATWTASGTPVFAVDESVYRSGARSGRIYGAPPNNSRGAVIMETTAMKIGQPYLISGWVKTEDVSASAYVRVQYKRSGQSINIEVANQIGGTTDWTYFSRVVTLPDTTDNPSAPLVKLEAFLENSTGTVWFDDFAIREHIPLQDFQLTADVLELETGTAEQLTAIFIPDDAANRNLRWTSSNPESVEVNQEGRVVGIAPGYAVITATSLETGESRKAVVVSAPSATLTVQPYAGTVQENGELTGVIGATDSAGGPIELTLAAAPESGTVTLRPDGSFTYYPKRNYAGADGFTVVATDRQGRSKAVRAAVTVTPLLKAPKLDLLWYATDKGVELTGVLGHVRTPAPEAVAWELAGQPQHGSAAVEASGVFRYTPQPGFVGYDSFVVAATASGLRTEERVNVFVVPEAADLESALEMQSGAGVHPRVLASAEDFAAIRSLIENDPHMREWFRRLQSDTEDMLETAPYPYAANGGNNGPIRDLLIQTSLMYQLTGERQYADRAIEELLSIAAFADWGGRHNNMLSLTYLAYSAGLAYDWLYDAMSDEERAVTKEAIGRHAFAHALDWYNGVFRHNGEFNNINLVDNGSFALAALALLGEEGEIGDQAAAVLQGAYRKLQQALRYQEEDGAWPEGPSYWQYGTQPLFLMMAALERTIGTDYGLSELDGMEEAGAYPLHLRGPGGPFNFNDGDIIDVYPQSLWLADRYGKPEYAWHAGRIYEETGLFSPFYLLLYKPGMFDSAPTELDRTFSGIETMTMRSGWDRNSVYAALRGFDETMISHNDLDAGTFVLDALGERWALDLGNENYNLPGFWQYEQGTRWTYYRKGAQGHNTVLINPLQNPVHMQDYAAAAKLIRSESKPLGAYGILDMTDRYPNDAVDYRRGMMLTGEREQLVIQDELRLKTPSEIYWQMHTKATIEIIEDGRAAILSQNDKRLYVKLLEAPDNAVFMELPAEPLPGTPNPDGQTINHGVRKLAVRMMDVAQADLSIWMVPLRTLDSLPQAQDAPSFTPLAEWTVPDGELSEKPVLPTLGGVRVNGEPIANFDPHQTYYKVVVPFEQTLVPVVEAQSSFETTVIEAGSVPGHTYVDVVDPADPGQRNRYTIAFIRGPIVGNPPEVNKWPVAAVTASASPQANLGYTPDKTIDGDRETRWTSEGKQWIMYDLGQTREVGAVSIAFFSGDSRIAYFSISASEDGENWTTVYGDGSSSGLTSEPEVFHFAPTQARFVRIDGFGNSSSRWNNMTEVGIFRPVPVALTIRTPETIRAGERAQLTAEFDYYDGGKAAAGDVVYNSSDPTILTIDEQGQARGLRIGSVEVTATDHQFGLTGSQTIEVVAAPPAPGPGSGPGAGAGDGNAGEEPVNGDEEEQPGANDGDHDGNGGSGEGVEFADTAGHWAEALIKQAATQGMVQGYPDRSFRPDEAVNRQEFAVMLMNALQLERGGTLERFGDRASIDNWASDSVAAAVQAGIIGGYEDGSFRPKAELTRAQLAVMAARALKLPAEETIEKTAFADDSSIPQWAKGTAEAVRKLGIMQGRGGNRFVPDGIVTRAEAIVVLLRILGLDLQ